MGVHALHVICEKASKFHAHYESEGSGIDEIDQLLEMAGLLPDIVPTSLKSDVVAEKLRLAGNRAFISLKDDMESLLQYTRAACSALPNGKEIAMAYANRSAVTFTLREFRDSIKDINRALEGKYPENLRYKLIERRGKCYLALEQFPLAAIDFQRVRSIVEESEGDEAKKRLTIMRLDELVAKCQGKENAVPKSLPCRPSMTHPPSSYIECASNAVDIVYSEKMGRHVIAAVDILPGDVLAIEKPYASVLLPPSYTLFCEFCKIRTHSALPCLQCNDIVYCDESCREKSWISHHSIECSALPSLNAISCDKMEFIALRTLLVSSKCGQSFLELVQQYPIESILTDGCSNPETRGFVDGKYLSSDYTSTHHLANNRHLRDKNDIFYRGVKAVCLLHVLRSATEFFKNTNLNHELGQIVAGELLRMYLMSVPCNAHEIAEMRVSFSPEGVTNSESVEIGGAIYPFHSLINHSCDPNVVRHAFGGDTVVLTAIQLIQRGEQIFDNYGYHHAVHDLASRQQHLKSQYFFECTCPACLEDWPLYCDLPDGPLPRTNVKVIAAVEEKAKIFSRILSDIKSNKLSEEDFRFLAEYLLFLHSNVKRPIKEYNKCQEVIKQYLSLRANCYIFHSK